VEVVLLAQQGVLVPVVRGLPEQQILEVVAVLGDITQEVIAVLVAQAVQESLPFVM